MGTHSLALVISVKIKLEQIPLKIREMDSPCLRRTPGELTYTKWSLDVDEDHAGRNEREGGYI